MVPANDAIATQEARVPASVRAVAKPMRPSGWTPPRAAAEFPVTRTTADMQAGRDAIPAGGRQPEPQHAPAVPALTPMPMPMPNPDSVMQPVVPDPGSDTDTDTDTGIWLDSSPGPNAVIVPHAGGVATSAPTPEGKVHAPLGALPAMEPARWADELDVRIRWFAARGGGTAEIRLDPPDLGALHVTVHAGRDGASVHFSAPSAPVRELLEHSLPRLRELLESSGMNLVNVNVAQQHDGGAGHRQAFAEARGAGNPAMSSEATVIAGEPPTRTSSRLIDAYV